MPTKNATSTQALIVAVTLSVLMYPICLFCLYQLFWRTLKLKCKKMVITLLTLMIISNFTYPTSRLLFYRGYEM